MPEAELEEKLLPPTEAPELPELFAIVADWPDELAFIPAQLQVTD
jgi:hypothetical protein